MVLLACDSRMRIPHDLASANPGRTPSRLRSLRVYAGMHRARPAFMRPYLPFTLLLLTVRAWAGSSSGGGNSGGGGGRLSQVSSGIGNATGTGSPHGSNGNTTTSNDNNYTECERYRYAREHD